MGEGMPMGVFSAGCLGVFDVIATASTYECLVLHFQSSSPAIFLLRSLMTGAATGDDQARCECFVLSGEQLFSPDDCIE